MPEELVVRQCAPTLAGLKTGSLFRAACTDKKALLAQIRDLNQRLREKGLCLIPLRFRDGNALLYLYRPARLKIDLKNELARRTLGNAGYLDESPERCIVNLIRRFQGEEFPHEIGFFLGYPYDDVVGFIENKGETSLCSGCWKVYSRARDAQACFCCYKTCTAAYEDLFDEGVPIDCLATIDESFPAQEAFAAAV